MEATRRRLLLRSTRNHAISEPDLLLSLTTGSSSCCSEAEAEAEAEAETEEADEEANVEAISVVSANFKCNDLECSLVLSDYAKCKCGAYLIKVRGTTHSILEILSRAIASIELTTTALYVYAQTYVQNLISLTALDLEIYTVILQGYHPCSL